MTIDPENIVHVIPADDLEEHNDKCVFPPIGNPYCECKCKPRHEFVLPAGMTVIHNSYDGREGVEWTNALLQSPTTEKP